MIREKALTDENFRRQLIADPKAAILDLTGIMLPKSMNISVLQEEEHLYYLVLPPSQGHETNQELTEAELQAVAAGVDWIDIWNSVDTCLI